MDCIAEGGYPEPAYKWSKNGFPIENLKEKEEITIESGSLIISNLKKHHKGEYQCLVENGIGIGNLHRKLYFIQINRYKNDILGSKILSFVLRFHKKIVLDHNGHIYI